MIALCELCVNRAGRRVLHELSATLRPGEVTVILGPNGCGKSTLLAALAGTLPYAGSARLNGHEVAGAAPELMADQRAVLPQHSEIAFPFCVADVVGFGARGALATDARARAARIEALLATLGLAGFGARNAMALSGGEAQRMHLARALLQAETAAGAPVWLFLDEPVSSLDLAHQIAVMDQARAFARRGGGVLAVLHDLNLAVRAADRLIVLAEGRITADGPPGAVLTDRLLNGVFACDVPLNAVPAAAPFLLVQAPASAPQAGAGAGDILQNTNT